MTVKSIVVYMVCCFSSLLCKPKPVGPILCHASQALNGQIPRSPADDGPASVCANEGEMCPAVELSTHQIHGDSHCGITTFNFNLFGRKPWWPPSIFFELPSFPMQRPLFCRCQCKGKAYYGRKLPLHGKVRTSELRSFESTTSHVAFEPWPWCICIVEASDSRVRVVYFVVFLLKLLKLLLWWHQ